MKYKENPACLVCGAPLRYLTQGVKMTCAYCGRDFLSNAHCENGHYICDTCHGKAGRLAIVWYCAHSDSRDPIGIAQALMKSPDIHMHGPEHHALVGAALLTAYHNCGGAVELEKALGELERRSRAVPGGICGLWGCCGAAVSAGMFLSLVTGADPMGTENWGLSNRMTAACLERIGAVGGPRCCKRDSFLAICAAAEFTSAHLGVNMELPERVWCGHFHRNRDCLKERCPFHPA